MTVPGACRTLLAVLVLCFMPTFLMAQVAGTAALTGAVTDPSGAIIVGADVTATNLATGAKRSAQTDSTGKYLMTQVPPGDYRVDVTATGFKTAVFEWSFGAGYMRDTDQRSGPYGRIGLNVRQ